MDTVLDKINRIDNLYMFVKKYSDKIPKFNKDFNEKIHMSFININKSFKKINIGNINNDMNVNEIFTLWNIINEIAYYIKEIIDTIKDISTRHQKQFVMHISEIDLQNINNLYSNIINTYNNYEKVNKSSDIQIIKLFNELINKQLKWNKSNVITNIDIISTLVIKNIYSTSLYTFIVQNVINDCLSYDTYVCEYILNKVETVKDEILLYSYKLEYNTSHIIQSNPRINSFGLTPHGKSMPISELMKSININIKEISDLSKISTKEQICFIVLNNIIEKPIEFSLWKLIEWDKAKKYIQSDKMGITQNIIDRTSTINFNYGKKKLKWNFKSEYYGSIDSDYFIIIENINNDSYRLFSTYVKNTDISGSSLHDTSGGGKEYKLHKNQINKFVEYIKHKGISKHPTRISMYHNIHEKKIMKNIFLPINFDIDDINVQSQTYETKYIKHELNTRLSDEFDNIVKKKYININSNKDFGKIIHDKSISDMFNNILIEHYDVFINNLKEKSLNNFPPSEMLHTFLMNLDQLNRQFNRKLHDTFISTNIDKKTYQNSSKNIILKKKFEEMIDHVIKVILSDTSNIYQSILYKNSLLKLSIIK
jgi:hypothetical protein